MKFCLYFRFAVLLSIMFNSKLFAFCYKTFSFRTLRGIHSMSTELQTKLIAFAKLYSVKQTELMQKLPYVNSKIERLSESVLNIDKEIGELEELKNATSDPTLSAMANNDMITMRSQKLELLWSLFEHLKKPVAADGDNVALEVVSGIGGQEAMLFSSEVFAMYSAYCEHRGWTFIGSDSQETELGGLRRGAAYVQGENVYKTLKFEGGVHRVQRVPTTERSGRVHTSTVCVAILPQPNETMSLNSINLKPSDMRIDTFRASGAGGQHVNKTDSAVRITHMPSGIVVECQQERSQVQNKQRALQNLRLRLYQQHVERQLQTEQQHRKLQIGTRERSDKIRTYNFPQDRVTDHRVAFTVHNLAEFLQGGAPLQKMIDTLQLESDVESVQETLDELIDSTHTDLLNKP